MKKMSIASSSTPKAPILPSKPPIFSFKLLEDSFEQESLPQPQEPSFEDEEQKTYQISNSQNLHIQKMPNAHKDLESDRAPNSPHRILKNLNDFVHVPPAPYKPV